MRLLDRDQPPQPIPPHIFDSPLFNFVLSIHTAPMIFGKHKPANRRARLYAKLIDWGLNAIVIILMFIVIMVMINKYEMIEPIHEPIYLFIVVTDVLLLFVLNAAQWILIALRGQTIGKIFMHIKIIDRKTHKLPSVAQSLLMRTWLNATLNMTGLYLLVDSLTIFRKDRRCIHDFLSRTIVVKGKTK